MLDIPLSPDNLTQAIMIEAWRIWEDALYFSVGHFQESRRWESVNLWMGIPTTIIAAITGITSLSNSGDSSLILGFSSGVVISFLAFTVAAASGLSTLLDPKSQASKHYHAASEYQALVNDVRLFCEIDCAKQGNCDKLEDCIRKFNIRLNRLNSQPIVISRWAKKIAEKEIKAGKYEYQIDQRIERNLPK